MTTPVPCGKDSSPNINITEDGGDIKYIALVVCKPIVSLTYRFSDILQRLSIFFTQQ